MTRNITVGIDGSRESRAAAEWAAREAQLRELPLQLLHVRELLPYTNAPLPERHWNERIPQETTTELQDRHPGLEVTTHHEAGQPATVLADAAENSELLVLGSRGLGAVAGFVLGSVALETVAHAPRPVVLVRAEGSHAEEPSTAKTPSGEVVLGLDLARLSDELIDFAFDAAVRWGVALRVIHARNLPRVLGYRTEPLDPIRAEQDEQAASALTGALFPWRTKFPDVQVIEQSLVGRPVEYLLEAASGASLVVVGRRIRRSGIGTHIGPVAHAVLHHATAPVAVVPHD